MPRKPTVTILRDIKRPGYTTPFYARTARIDFYSAKKGHQIIYQQGPRYGSVGDCCDDLTHAELLELERDGFVRIEGGSNAT